MRPIEPETRATGPASKPEDLGEMRAGSERQLPIRDERLRAPTGHALTRSLPPQDGLEVAELCPRRGTDQRIEWRVGEAGDELREPGRRKERLRSLGPEDALFADPVRAVHRPLLRRATQCVGRSRVAGTAPRPPARPGAARTE